MAGSVIEFRAYPNDTLQNAQGLVWQFLTGVDTGPVGVEAQVCCGIMLLNDGDYIEIDTSAQGNLVVPSFKVVRISGLTLP